MFCVIMNVTFYKKSRKYKIYKKIKMSSKNLTLIILNSDDK
jgi:glutamate formiminotransferase